MQYSDNDMDEFFVEAAGNYPVKMTEDGWELIAGKLPTTHLTGTVAAPVIKRNIRRGSIVFLLFCLIICGAGLWIHLQPKDNRPEVLLVNQPESGWLKPGIDQKAKPVGGGFGSTQKLRETFINSLRDQSAFIVETEKVGKQLVTNPKRNPESADHQVTVTDRAKIQAVQSGWSSRPASGERINAPSLLSGLLSTTKPAPVRTIRNHQFYAGLVAGPQMNQVHQQGMTKIGFSAGILLGFRFNNRLAVETGLLVANKKYFTRGDQFSMAEVAPTMPSGMQVESLDASSRFLELPVKLKYDFYKKTNSNFFWTAGFCSYVLTEEQNNYKAMVNGSPKNFKGSYKANNNYFSSAVQISTGYEYKTGKNTKLRIEGYIQVPLKGMGIGSLPLQSTGISVGITIP